MRPLEMKAELLRRGNVGKASRWLAAASLLLLLAVAGCATNQAATAEKPRGEPRPDRALVYIIDPGNSQSGQRCWIFDSTTPLGALEAKSYLFVYLEPGPHWLWNRMGGSGHSIHGRNVLSFEAGKTYYLWLSQDPNAWPALVFLKIGQQAFDQAVRTAEFLPQIEEDRKTGLRMVRQYGQDALPVPLPPGASAPVSGGEEGRVRLAAGTPIQLELEENATTLHAEPGQKLLFKVARDLEVDDRTVVPAGLPVEGVVRRAYHPKIFGFPGFLEVEIPSLRLPDGTVIALFGLMGAVGGRDPAGQTSAALVQGANAVPGSYLSMALALLALPGLFVTGGDPWLLAGTWTTAYVRTESWATPPAPAAPVATAGEAAPAAMVVSAESLAAVPVTAKGRVEAEWIVRLALASAPKEVWIEAVGATAVPERIGPSKTRLREGACELTFPAWAVLRWARLNSGPTIPVRLRGTAADGSAFTATVPFGLQFETPR